jgi:Mrp family chromosome partitioning ATPase
VVLATLVNNVVLVLRADKSKREEAEAAKERLANVSKDIVGVVLNGVNPRSERYSYSLWISALFKQRLPGIQRARDPVVVSGTGPEPAGRMRKRYLADLRGRPLSSENGIIR